MNTIARRTAKRTLVGALSAALVLTSFSIGPVQAAPPNKAPAAAPANASAMPTDVSSRKRHYRRGSNPAAAMAMFGAIAGGIIAMSQARKYQRHYYGGVPYGYYGPYYGPRYYGPPAGYGYYGYGPRYW